MINNNSEYYIHSGKYSIKAILFAFIFGSIATFILSLVYIYALRWIPFVYINFFITIGYGLLVGSATGTGFFMGKGRNKKISNLLGVGMGFFAYYFSWGIYSFVNFNILTFSPFNIYQIMGIGLKESFWSIYNISVKGLILGVFWFIEALIIILSCWIGASSQSNSSIFCEKCDDWVTKTNRIENFESINDYNDLKENVLKGDHSLIKKLQEPSSKSMTIVLSNCDKCNDFYLMCAEENVISKNDKGEDQISSDTKIDNLFISKESFEAIKSL